MLCDICQEGEVTKEVVSDLIPYGSPLQAEIPVEVPVFTCPACEMSYTYWEGEEIREKAVKDYLEGL